jgi:hypothetical protein
MLLNPCCQHFSIANIPLSLYLYLNTSLSDSVITVFQRLTTAIQRFIIINHNVQNTVESADENVARCEHKLKKLIIWPMR